jgi:hypothetical protein
MTVETKRLYMIKKTIENLTNLYPDITINDGEGIPYSSSGSIGDWVYFSHSANGNEVDEIDENIALTRGTDSGLYNPYYETYWDTDRTDVFIPKGEINGRKIEDWSQTPTGTLWNSDGGDVYGDYTQNEFTSRDYKGFRESLNNQIGNYILIKPLVMWDVLNDNYYEFIFITWGSDDGGSFSYMRRKLTPKS